MTDREALIRGAAIDLDARDPQFIREQLPLWWLLSTLYFRAEVRGLDRVPEERPVLFVGNHSGGNMTPDTVVFLLAFNAYFGVERPLYALAHAMVTSFPLIGPFVRKLGTITAGHEGARSAFDRGACVLVYPGGDVDVHRPWTARHEVRFAGRKGFVRLARERGVPIQPVVACGGHDTLVTLTDGSSLARMLGLDRLGRLKVFPISIALPWGLNFGDLLGHIPFPVKILVEILDPIDLAARFPDADDREVYDYVTSLMQEKLNALAAERILPPFL